MICQGSLDLDEPATSVLADEADAAAMERRPGRPCAPIDGTLAGGSSVL